MRVSSPWPVRTIVSAGTISRSAGSGWWVLASGSAGRGLERVVGVVGREERAFARGIGRSQVPPGGLVLVVGVAEAVGVKVKVATIRARLRASTVR